MQKIGKSFLVAGFTLVASIGLSSCYKADISTSPNQIKSEVGDIVCPQSYDVVLDFFSQVTTLQASKPAQQNYPTQMDEEVFAQAMDTDGVFKGVANTYLKSELYQLYQEFYQDIKYLSSFENNANLTQLISYLKVEDADNHLRKELIEKYKSKINVISKNMQSMGYTCPNENDVTGRDPAGSAPPTPSAPTLTEREKVTNQLVYSMRKLFAVTYQSCQVLNRKPLDKTDKNVQGIKEECCYEETRGLVRHIESLSLVQKTHPYLQSSYDSKCIDIRKNPLIYDFGGRPAFTRGSAGKLNFFVNNDGSEVLGYDCSAMVYSVMMNAGLRMKENKMFVASDVDAAQSRQFLDPLSKGWSCLNPVRFETSSPEPLLAGDIASMDGHTFMIYRAGMDPFGIDKITDCKKVDPQNFDFDIIQSSPSKDGVGVNVYVGKDYLLTNDTMERGFVEYAKNYCERKKNSSVKKVALDYFSIVRISTSAACKMPSISYESEACVQSCL